MDTGSNKLPRQLEGVALGCLSCCDYKLIKPQHGNGDAPHYECKYGKNPEDCPTCKKNEEQE